MGNRGNIKIGDIYLYNHWDGHKNRYALQRALRRRERWQEQEYLTRIIFCEMLEGDIDGSTGYGISTERIVDTYPLLEVDVDSQHVRQGPLSWSFEEFIQADFDREENR